MLPSQIYRHLTPPPRYLPPRFGLTEVARYDLRDIDFLSVDGSSRVALVADRSGNSAVNCLVLNGVSGNSATLPDSAALSITGDIDIQVFTALTSWLPAARNPLVSKWDGGSGQRSYLFTVEPTTGVLALRHSTDGSTAVTNLSTVAPTVSNFGALWVRATRKSSDGSVKFYTSQDGTTWTQLGTTVAGASGAILDSTSAVGIGLNIAPAGTATEWASGNIFRVRILNGYDGAGTVQLDANFSLPAKLATSFTESSSNAATVTINTSGDIGARISGARDIVQFTNTKKFVITLDPFGNSMLGDGSNDYYKAAAFVLVQPESIILTASQETWSIDDVLFDGFAGDGMALSQDTTTPRLAMYAGALQPVTTDLPVATRGIIQCVYLNAANGSSIRINRMNTTTGNSGTSNANGFLLGCHGTLTRFANIRFNEARIFSISLDSIAQDREARYQARKWNIAA